jgi:hypothetical protein
MKTKLIFVAIVLALAVAWIGVHYQIPLLMGVMLIGLGIFSAVIGIRMIITRKAEVPTSSGYQAYKEIHTGVSAQMWGVLFVIFSAPMAALGAGYLLWGNSPPAGVIERLIRVPLVSGLAIVVTGVALLLYGLTRVLPGKSAFVETKIGPFERTLTAVGYSFVGTIVILAGIVRAIAPGALTRFRDAAIQWLLSFAK